MPATEPTGSTTPYADLSPSVVLDALDGVGLRGDGRLIQLNSYENRVFQVFLEDGRVVVAKFYRPGRWSDAQILEEHAFAAELAAAEIPVAAPLVLQGDAASTHASSVSLIGPTLGRFTSSAGAYRFGVCERIAGRAPELEDADTLEWIGRFVGRIHAVGALSPFVHRQTLDPQTFGHSNRDWLLASDLIPPDALPYWRDVTNAHLVAPNVVTFLDRRIPAWFRLTFAGSRPTEMRMTAAAHFMVDRYVAFDGPADVSPPPSR